MDLVDLVEPGTGMGGQNTGQAGSEAGTEHHGNPLLAGTVGQPRDSDRLRQPVTAQDHRRSCREGRLDRRQLGATWRGDDDDVRIAAAAELAARLGSVVVLSNVTGSVIGSVLSGEGEGLELPVILVGPASAYYHVNYGSLSWARSLLEDDRLYLDGYSLLGARLGGEPGVIRVPESVPEGAYLDVELSALVGGGEYSAVARLRFDANGEFLGIRGLVPQVIHIWRGLSDVYIVVYPPIARAGEQVVHELMLYYLWEIYRLYGDSSALALASIIMAEYYPAPRRAGDLWSLARDSYYLYSEARGFDPSASRIYSEGLRIEVKVIPGVGLVWIGSLVSVVSALLLAALPPRLLYGVVDKSLGRGSGDRGAGGG
jgi:hypothetical protein